MPAFSLLELLIVLAIVSIFLAFSFPAAKHFSDSAQDDILQAQLSHTIQQAKRAARANRLPVVLCHSRNMLTCGGEWIDGQLMFLDENEDGVIREKEQVLAMIQSPVKQGKLYFRSYPRYRGYLLFLPAGLTAQDNGTFWYCHSEKASPVWAMMLSKAGMLRVQYPDQAGQIKDAHGVVLTCGDEKINT